MPSPRMFRSETDTRHEEPAQDPTPDTRGADDELLVFASETKPRGARKVRADEALPQNQQPGTRPVATSVKSEGLPEREWPRAKALGFWALVLGIVAIGLVGFQTVRAGLELLATNGQPRKLKVTSQPEGLQVAVDGSVIGVTPVTLAVTPGNHSVAVRLRGKQRVVPVIVTPNADISQHFEMTADNSSGRYGSLAVETDPPGAPVKIDGVARGVSPLTIPYLTPTKHTITVAGARGTVRRSVVVQPGAVTSVVFALSQ
jgi:hypothetical protein